MTLGIAAKSSIKKVSMFETPAGASSERKMAQPSPRGTEIRSATTDVTTVPKMHGSAPNSSVTGSQVVEVRKEKPNLCRVSAESDHNCQTSRKVIRMILTANV